MLRAHTSCLSPAPEALLHPFLSLLLFFCAQKGIQLFVCRVIDSFIVLSVDDVKGQIASSTSVPPTLATANLHSSLRRDQINI